MSLALIELSPEELTETIYALETAHLWTAGCVWSWPEDHPKRAELEQRGRHVGHVLEQFRALAEVQL